MNFADFSVNSQLTFMIVHTHYILVIQQQKLDPLTCADHISIAVLDPCVCPANKNIAMRRHLARWTHLLFPIVYLSKFQPKTALEVLGTRVNNAEILLYKPWRPKSFFNLKSSLIS